MSTATKYKAGGVWLDGAADTPTYTRPADWLTLPTLLTSDKKLVGLVAIFPHGSNFLALSAVGDYTVDWGDGSAPENVLSGVQANHEYSYAAISNTTDSTRGYRQCIVTVTPQGATWTNVNIARKHNQTGLSTASSPWLDISVAGSTLTSFTTYNGSTFPRLLEQFTWIGTIALTSMASFFQGCESLQSVVFTNTSSVTNMSNMFRECTALKTVPLLVTTSVTNMSTMFYGCSSLVSVPLFNTATVTNMSNMFNTCYSLRTVPLFNTAAVTNMAAMFTSCYSLQTVPLFVTTAVTDMSDMFNTCVSLQSVPLFVTTSVTTMSNMFYSCSSLPTVPLFNTGTVTNMNGMFAYCWALRFVPLFNTANVTNMGSMFSNCRNLPAVPLFNTGNVTDMSSIFTTCPLLGRGAMSGTKVNISYSGCRLSSAELDLIYTNLASGVTAKTVTVTSNFGTTGDDPTIATAKGWTVTGS